jgi:hypothetical protein
VIPVIRRLGIALGSFIAAWLAVSLVAGVFLGSASVGNWLVWGVAIGIGAFVYRDIIRRDSRRS